MKQLKFFDAALVAPPVLLPAAPPGSLLLREVAAPIGLEAR